MFIFATLTLDGKNIVLLALAYQGISLKRGQTPSNKFKGGQTQLIQGEGEDNPTIINDNRESQLPGRGGGGGGGEQINPKEWVANIYIPLVRNKPHQIVSTRVPYIPFNDSFDRVVWLHHVTHILDHLKRSREKKLQL